MQIGDILGCCKFVSRFLDGAVLEIVDREASRQILEGNTAAKFYQHYYNSKISYIK